MSEQRSRSPRGDDRSPGDGITWRYEGSRDVRRRSRSPVLRRSRSPEREGERKLDAAPGEEGEYPGEGGLRPSTPSSPQKHDNFPSEDNQWHQRYSHLRRRGDYYRPEDAGWRGRGSYYRPRYHWDYEAPRRSARSPPMYADLDATHGEDDHHVALQYDDPTDWLKLRDQVTGQRYHYSPSTGRRYDPPPFPAYNPKVHGNYVNWEQKKKEAEGSDDEYDMPQPVPASQANYGSTASFNRFNNAFANTAVHPTRAPGAHTGAAKSDRQLKAYYDLDAADQDQSGKSGKAERASRVPTKAEMQMFKQKKEEKQRRNRDALYKD